MGMLEEYDEVDRQVIEPLYRSTRAARRLIREQSERENLARDLLLSSLLSTSGVPLLAFSEDERKQATALLKKATAAIRDLRKMLGGK